MAKKETRAVHGAFNHLPNARPVSTPIYLSSTYHRNEDGSYNEDLIYTRESNPNRLILEKAMTDLEGGACAFAFGSGMAAVHAVFQSLEPGKKVLIPDDAYYAVRQLAEKVFKRWGLTAEYIDMSDLDVVVKSLSDDVALIWLESPSNPQLKITNISAVADLTKKHGIICAVDNTWPTPILQNPIALGADIVIHSSTKYLGGHSDVLGGVVIMAQENEQAERIHDIQKLGGGVPSPFDCWLISRGIQSLSVRIKEQSLSAMKLAAWLSNHPKVEMVLYPGLEDHDGHEIAKRQMTRGYGGMFSVLLKENVKKILEISHQLRYFTSATSLGGVESLIEHRNSTEGPESTTPENLLRVSVGLEHVDDLIADWEQALKE